MDEAVPAKPAQSTAADRPLVGRHAIVTGASRGIGAAIALELARLGADLSVVARRATALGDIVPRLKAAGAGRVADIAADVTDERAVGGAFDRAAATLGPPSILVNNAGGAESAPFGRTDPALWRRMIDLNLTSVYLCTRAVAPAMLAAGYGRIVNVASTAGLKGYAYVSAYVAAKHGVVGITRALALEFAKSGVTVNAVCPGYTDTPMIADAVAAIAAKTRRSAEDARASLAATNPMGRLVRPDEVAAVVGWLCLPEASAMTGQAIAIAGGEVT
ncbi:MAG: SDR family oxidoreductase [Proteobacteria bacterium]|nr:SDR family oxidoreductase [Pseudomonadota bacterium]